MRFTIYIFSFLLIGCSVSNSSNEGTGETNTSTLNKATEVIEKNLSAEQFKTALETMDKDGTILDVRTKEEFEMGAIEGAININFYDTDFIQQTDSLNKDKPVFLYCMSGGRSAKAMKILSTNGFTEIYNLIGGYGAWPYKN